jgi:hypothetical protein
MNVLDGIVEVVAFELVKIGSEVSHYKCQTLDPVLPILVVIQILRYYIDGLVKVLVIANECRVLHHFLVQLLDGDP